MCRTLNLRSDSLHHVATWQKCWGPHAQTYNNKGLSAKILLDSFMSQNLSTYTVTPVTIWQNELINQLICIIILFKVKRNILGHRKDYWGPLEALEQVAPESSEIVKSVQNLPNIRYMHTLKHLFFSFLRNMNSKIQHCPKWKK